MAGDRGYLEWNELAYQTYLDETRKEMDSEISNLIRKVANLRLNDKIVYVLQTRGKLLRPTLVLLCGQSVGADKGPLKKLALAIELLHEATLVHDDILDDDSFRRNAVAVHAKWGVRDAILVGDALAALSLNLAAEYGKEISKIVSQTCLLLCDGEYMDASMANAELSERDYFEKITKKSASLFKVATLCGAIAGEGSSLEKDSLAEFGEKLGMAYQIRDDLSDVTTLKEDLALNLNDFQTLPLIHMKNKEKGSKIEDNLEQKIIPKELCERLKDTGSLNYCTNKINEYLDGAVVSLESLKRSVYKKHLVELAESLRHS